MKISAALQNIKRGVHHATEHVSHVTKNVVNKATTKATNLKSYVVSKLTISNQNKTKIKTIAKKIIDFVKSKKSLIFFGSSVLFSYYMAPAAAFEYLAKTGFSLTSSFVSGMLLGTSLLALKNILFLHPVRKPQNTDSKTSRNDKINYLLGISNLFQTYLNPLSLGIVIATAGVVTVNTAYKFLLPPDEIKKDCQITFLVPKELSEDVKVS